MQSSSTIGAITVDPGGSIPKATKPMSGAAPPAICRESTVTNTDIRDDTTTGPLATRLLKVAVASMFILTATWTACGGGTGVSVGHAVKEVTQRANDAGILQQNHFYRFGHYEIDYNDVYVETTNTYPLKIATCAYALFHQLTCRFLHSGPWETDLLRELRSEAVRLHASGALTISEREEDTIQTAQKSVEAQNKAE